MARSRCAVASGRLPAASSSCDLAHQPAVGLAQGGVQVVEVVGLEIGGRLEVRAREPEVAVVVGGERQAAGEAGVGGVALAAHAAHARGGQVVDRGDLPREVVEGVGAALAAGDGADGGGEPRALGPGAEGAQPLARLGERPHPQEDHGQLGGGALEPRAQLPHLVEGEVRQLAAGVARLGRGLAPRGDVRRRGVEHVAGRDDGRHLALDLRELALAHPRTLEVLAVAQAPLGDAVPGGAGVGGGVFEREEDAGGAERGALLAPHRRRREEGARGRLEVGREHVARELAR